MLAGAQADRLGVLSWIFRHKNRLQVVYGAVETPPLAGARFGEVRDRGPRPGIMSHRIERRSRLVEVEDEETSSIAPTIERVRHRAQRRAHAAAAGASHRPRERSDASEGDHGVSCSSANTWKSLHVVVGSPGVHGKGFGSTSTRVHCGR